jgi:hypothetical protein
MTSFAEQSKQLANFNLEDYEQASNELVRVNIAKFKRVILKQLTDYTLNQGSAIIDSEAENFSEALQATVNNIFSSAARALVDHDTVCLKAYNSDGEEIAEYYFAQDENNNIFQVFVYQDNEGNPVYDHRGCLQINHTSEPVSISQDETAEYEILSLTFKVLNHLKYMIKGEEDCVIPLSKVQIDYVTGELKVAEYDLDDIEDMKRFALIVASSGFSVKKIHPILDILNIQS